MLFPSHHKPTPARPCFYVDTMKRLFALLLATFLLFSSSMANEITCYRPDRKSLSSENAQTCIGVQGSVSMCCSSSDQCLRNGLCKVAGNSTKGTNATYWRDACSDPRWPSVGCLKACADGDLESGNSLMTPCDGTDYSETWCCGHSRDCCGKNNEVRVPRDIYKSATASASTFAPTSSSTSASTPTTADPGSPSSSESSSGLSTGGKAGVGVGVAVGGMGIIGLASYFYRQRKTKTSAINADPMEQTLSSPYDRYDPYNPQQLELSQQSQVHEKPAGTQDSRHELPSEPVYTTIGR